jgi:hypothetical protein
VICVNYRPDDCLLSAFDDVLKPNFIQALTLNKPIVILGDLNCDVLKENCSKSKALAKFAAEMNLSQLIKSPTRITNTTQSLLDVVLVSSNSPVRRSGVLNTTISDHLPVYVELKLKSPKIIPHYINVRSYKNYSPSLFITDLASKSRNLISIFNEDDVNTKLTTFNQTIQSTLDSHAPIKTVKVRNRHCPFVTQDIKVLMKTRDQLHRRYLQTRDELDWNNFKNSRNAVKKMLRDSEIIIQKKYSNIKITQALFGKSLIKPYRQKVKKYKSTQKTQRQSLTNSTSFSRPWAKTQQKHPFVWQKRTTLPRRKHL